MIWNLRPIMIAPRLHPKGKSAVAVQHEIDHCDGILLVEREAAA